MSELFKEIGKLLLNEGIEAGKGPVNRVLENRGDQFGNFLSKKTDNLIDKLIKRKK